MLRGNETAPMARMALRQYGLEDVNLFQLGGSSNTNFKVDTSVASYVLHMDTAARQSQLVLEAVCDWLLYLKDRALLNVPQPIANLWGKYVTDIGTDRPLLCTLMTWLPGKIPDTVDAMSDAQLAQVGRLMASLHSHTSELGLNLPTMDMGYFDGRLLNLCHALRATEFPNDDLQRFRLKMTQIIADYGELLQARDSYGIIHADFHSGNYLLDGDAVYLIDFENCKFGYYFYDLSLALMELSAQQRSAFLKGYQSLRPLPDDFGMLLSRFLCLAYVDNLGFHASNPAELEYIVGEMPFVIEACLMAQ